MAKPCWIALDSRTFETEAEAVAYETTLHKRDELNELWNNVPEGGVTFIVVYWDKIMKIMEGN